MGGPGRHAGQRLARLGGVGHADAGAGRDHHEGGQGPFQQHRAVSDKQRIFLARHLLGRSARGNQGVKARDSPTGDRDKQERYHGGGLFRLSTAPPGPRCCN
jgi:hypothetical protein